MNKIYFFSGTHRDREWYQSFQYFRMKSVKDINEMIDYLETRQDFGTFHLDGQTIILEDYAEIMPENIERLKKLLKDKRILVGPWFTMPDEFNVSGEALIRNLMLGHDLCEKWGAPVWKVGYICDIFGHIAQMPQIFSLFGIDCAVLGRGVNDCTTDVLFRWRSPDGTECLTYRVPEKCGYGSFCMEVISDGKGGETDPRSPLFREKTKKYIDREINRNGGGNLIVFDGFDHAPIHKDTPEYLKIISELYPDREILHTDISDFFKEKKNRKCGEKTGELIETAKIPADYLHLLTNVLSSRVTLKRENDECEYSLTFFLEPMVVFFAKNDTYYKKYIDVAWNFLMQNHSHDSICGCSIDRVHRDMLYRYSQVEEIVESCSENILSEEVGGVERIDKNGSYLNIFNPLPYGGRETVKVKIYFSPEFPKYHEPFGYEDICAFRLFDENGNEIEYAVTSVKTSQNVRFRGEATFVADEYEVAFRAELKPFGVTVFRVEPQTGPVRYAGSLANTRGKLNNGIVEVSVCGNEVDITYLVTSRKYKNCIGFIDDAEIGDGWFSVRPKVSSSVVYRITGVAVTCSNPAYSSMRVTFESEIPEKIICENGYRESEKRLKSRVIVDFALYVGSGKIYMDILYDNEATDHRLRLVFTCGIEGDYFANQAFCFVDRAPGILPERIEWKEADCIEKGFDGIIGKEDKNGGICLLSDFGLKECADDGDSIYVTLLRGFSKTKSTNGETGGQELGMHHYGFVIIPFEGHAKRVEVQREQDRLRAKNVAYITQKSSKSQSLFAVEGACVSCVKRVKDGVLLRVYNPDKKDSRVKIKGHEGEIYFCDVFGNITERVADEFDLKACRITNILLA